jgi:hypothetical protein
VDDAQVGLAAVVKLTPIDISLAGAQTIASANLFSARTRERQSLHRRTPRRLSTWRPDSLMISGGASNSERGDQYELESRACSGAEPSVDIPN